MKKRFEVRHYDESLINAYDNKLNSSIIIGVEGVIDLLNKQDEKIKELTEQNKKLKEDLIYEKNFWAKNNRINLMLYKELENENHQLKQSQNSKAIEVLEDLRNHFALKDAKLDSYDIIADYGDILEWIADKITELRGDK